MINQLRKWMLTETGFRVCCLAVCPLITWSCYQFVWRRRVIDAQSFILFYLCRKSNDWRRAFLSALSLSSLINPGGIDIDNFGIIGKRHTLTKEWCCYTRLSSKFKHREDGRHQKDWMLHWLWLVCIWNSRGAFTDLAPTSVTIQLLCVDISEEQWTCLASPWCWSWVSNLSDINLSIGNLKLNLPRFIPVFLGGIMVGSGEQQLQQYTYISQLHSRRWLCRQHTTMEEAGMA